MNLDEQSSDTISRRDDSLFQNRQKEMSIFRSLFIDTSKSFPIISILGPGGIGKTTLLEKLVTIAEEYNSLILKANLEETKIATDILITLTQSKKEKTFKKFKELNKKFSEIWEKVFQASQGRQNKLSSITKDFVGAGIVGALGLTIGGPIGLIAGAAVGALGGSYTEEAIKKGVTTFTKLGISVEEATLAMNPVHELTNAFIEDLKKITKKNKVVIMLDSYERATNLEKWITLSFVDPLISINKNIIIVIASRDPLTTGWKKINRRIIPLYLEPLNSSDAKIFLQRKGVTSASDISNIITQSNGIPWLLELLAEAELLSAYSSRLSQQDIRISEGFFIERLLDHLPNNQRTIIEAASILRNFNQDILSALLGKEIDIHDFNSTINLGFVETRDDKKWSIRNEIRSKIEDSLHSRTPQTITHYHESAIKTYKLLSGFPDRLLNMSAIIELIYHCFKLDGQTGLQEFQRIFNFLSNPPNLPACEAVVTELKSAVIRGDCPNGWEEYFKGRYFYLENNWDEAKRSFQLISYSEDYDAYLRAFSLQQLGWIEYFQGNIKFALDILRRSYNIFQQLNNTLEIDLTINHLGRISRRLGQRDLAMAYHQIVLERDDRVDQDERLVARGKIEAYRCISRLWRDNGQWDKAIEFCNKSLSLARKNNEYYDEGLALTRLAELYVYKGRWQEAQIVCDSSLAILNGFENDLALAGAHNIAGRIATWNQRNEEAINHYLHALFLYRMISGNIGVVMVMLDLARHYMFIGDIKKAFNYSNEANIIADSIGDDVLKAICTTSLAELILIQGDWDKAKNLYETSMNILYENGNQYKYTEVLIGLVSCLWKLSEKARADEWINTIQELVDDYSYPDLSAHFSMIKTAILYDQNSEQFDMHLIDTGYKKAEKYSKCLANFLLHKIRLQWSIGLHEDFLKYLTRNNPKVKELKEPTLVKNNFIIDSNNGQISLVNKNPLFQLKSNQQIVLHHHGLTKAREEMRIQGRDDTYLVGSSKNKLQNVSSEILNKLELREVKLNKIVIYSSPSRRSYETAFALSNELYRRIGKNVMINIREDLENISLGQWEGQYKSELINDPIWKRFYSGRDLIVSAPGTSVDGSSPESPLQVIERTSKVFLEAIENGRNAIFIGHKMSVIIPGVLLFAPKLILDFDNVLNWKKLDFPEGGYVLLSEKEIEISH